VKKAALALLVAAAGLVLAEGACRAYLCSRAQPDGAFELYAIGGSTTAGEPYDRRLSFPALVDAMFDSSIGGRRIVVDNLSRPGDSIYPQAIALSSRLRFRNKSNPAAVLIYSGHNEHFTAYRTEGRLAKAYVSLRSALLGRSFLVSAAAPALERALRARGTRSLATYERDMRSAIEASLENGAVPILSTLVSNLSEIEPTLDCGSMTRDALIALVRSGRPSDPCLRPLADFRLAKLAEASGDFRGAAAGYWKVVDEDPHNGFGRATTEQNALVRRLAAEYKVPLVDAVALFAAASPHGLIGPGLLSDGHHPSLEGYLILARAYSEALSRAFHEPVKRPLKSAAEALVRARYDAIDLAAARLYSGRWLLRASVGHPAPFGRMVLAKRSFEDAAALDPDDLRARLGLALVEANADGLLLLDGNAARLVERLGLPRNSLTREELNAAIAGISPGAR
jgi:hypothetical protein